MRSPHSETRQGNGGSKKSAKRNKSKFRLAVTHKEQSGGRWRELYERKRAWVRGLKVIQDHDTSDARLVNSAKTKAGYRVSPPSQTNWDDQEPG